MENRFASKSGGSNVVLAVMPNARFFVTAAMAVIGFYHNQSALRHGEIATVGQMLLAMVGSVIGHCAARRMQLSMLSS